MTIENREVTILENRKWVIAEVLIDEESPLYRKAFLQAQKKSLYTMNSSQAGEFRSNELKLQKQFMGTLAEVCCELFLKKILKRSQLNDWKVQRYDDVRTDDFKSPANEYDIKILKSDGEKSFIIESRSSIAKDRSLKKALEDFDILGPYTSSVKGKEEYCDIYIRPLYFYLNYLKRDYPESKFKELLQQGWVKLYIVAGCFKQDIKDKGYWKSMGQGLSQFHVIKIINSWDITEFEHRLKNFLNA